MNLQTQLIQLQHKIQGLFPKDFSIDVYVLDSHGDDAVIYSVGINYHVGDDIKMTRKEFSWLTTPRPPVSIQESATSILVSWSPVQICGLDSALIRVQYILEVADGRDCGNRKFNSFVSTPIPKVGMETHFFKAVYRGSDVTSFLVSDLRANMGYYFRLSIHCMDMQLMSPVSSAQTILGVPSAPGVPKINVTKWISPYGSAGSRRLHVMWRESVPNGTPITRYQMQAKEVRLPSSDTVEPVKISSETEELLFREEISAGFFVSKWGVLYSNLLPEFTCSGPSAEAIKWAVRVRAQNAAGWSEFSPSAHISYVSHPSLFPSWFRSKSVTGQSDHHNISHSAAEIASHSQNAVLITDQ